MCASQYRKNILRTFLSFLTKYDPGEGKAEVEGLPVYRN
jgi:hypothetical protein